MDYSRQESFGAGGLSINAEVDHRLLRNFHLREYRGGRVSREDLCDASPELIRVATNLGVEAKRPCPICDSDSLVLVRFAFGQGLPAHGRAISEEKEIETIGRTARGIDLYVVEVCPQCSWNHLLRKLGGSGGNGGD